jgi:hypothetical protein
VKRVGLENSAWMSSALVVVGLAVYATLGRLGYGWVALALVLVSAGIRVVGVVAGTNVMRGLPENRSTIGAALVDTSSQITTGIGIAATGTILAAMFTGSIATAHWTPPQTSQFEAAITVAGLTLTIAAGALVTWAYLRTRQTAPAPEPVAA